MGPTRFGIGDDGPAERLDFVEGGAKCGACEELGEAVEWVLEAEGDVI